MRLISFFAVVIVFLITHLLEAQESVPKLINYQGKLTDAESQPLGGEAGGTFKLRFKIYPVPTEGDAVWAEERDVVVIGGIFNVALGGAGGVAVAEIPMDLGVAFVAPERFLETTVVSGPEGEINQTLAPRQQLASVPYALVSQTTDRAAIAESLIPELMKMLNPPGTIIAYGGAVTDPGGRPIVEPVPGYLLCNGAVIDDVLEDGKYADLKAAINTRWGNGQDSDFSTVNLPDLRGVFLRGWSGAASDRFVDEDRNNGVIREARLSGGATANAVGSFQQDQLESHNHSSQGAHQVATQTTSGWWVLADQSTNVNRTERDVDFSGGSETRSKNAYVAYLIKY